MKIKSKERRVSNKIILKKVREKLDKILVFQKEELV